MALMKKEKFSDYDEDLIHELLHIGLGNSSTVLSRMLDQRVESKITHMKYMKVDDFMTHLGGRQKLMTIFLKISGDIEGCALNVLSAENAMMFINALNSPLNIKKRKMDLYGVDTLKEYSNLIIGAYVASLSKMMDLDFKFSIPHYSHDDTLKIYKQIILKNLKEDPTHMFNSQNQLYCEAFEFPIYSDLLINIFPDSLTNLVDATKKKWSASEK